MVSLELRTTPRTLIEDTLSAPCITGKAGLEALEDCLLWMMSSFVFKALSFKLLRAAQTEILLNSAWAVRDLLDYLLDWWPLLANEHAYNINRTLYAFLVSKMTPFG